MDKILYEIQHYFGVRTGKMHLKVVERNILDSSEEIDETKIIIYTGGIFKNRLKYDDLNRIYIEHSNGMLGINCRKCFTIDNSMIPLLIHKIQEESYNELKGNMQQLQKALDSIKKL
jgi:hypothetical protein